MPRIVSLIVLALLAATSAYCEVYKWVDPDGTVQYSDQPPPGAVKEQSLGIKSKTSGSEAPGTEKTAPKASGPKTYIEQDAEFRKRQVETAEKRAKEEKALADAKERQQNCELARANLRTLQSGVRATRINDKGEQEYLDDNQRQQEMAVAQKSADSWCNPAK